MEQGETYPITYAILGLLASGGPQSGYDLRRLFDNLLAPMWAAAQSQIYKELRRMQALGWVTMERQEQESRPARKLYALTDTGHTALRAWLAQPPDVFQLRDELLLKMLFGSFAEPADLAQHLRATIATHEMRLLAYRQGALLLPPQGNLSLRHERRNPYLTEAEPDPYFQLVLRFAIAFEQTYLRWMYEALEEMTNQADQRSDAHD